MKEKRRGVPLIVFGIIVIVIGIGLWVYGGIIDGNYEMHLESIFSSGHRNSTGTTLTSIGIGAIVIGSILALIGIILYATSGKKPLEANIVTMKQENVINADNSFINSMFSNAHGQYCVIFESKGNCIWEQQGKQYKGSYRKLNNVEWIISIEGYGDAFCFRMQGHDIFVVGGSINETFYRTIATGNKGFSGLGIDYSQKTEVFNIQQTPRDSKAKTNTQPIDKNLNNSPNELFSNKDSVKVCLNCGEQNPADANICSSCGGFYFRQNTL